MRRYLAVEPCHHPLGRSLVLDGQSKLHPATLIASRMEVQAAKLLELLTFINLHLLWLVVQLVVVHKTIGTQIATEAHHRPKVLRQLSKSVWGQLVQQHLKVSSSPHL
jgi:hypothetical protein